MILVRQVFQAQFGRAGEVAARMKEGMQQDMQASGAPTRWRLLTDLSGPYDTVVLEIEAESLAQWEQARKRLFSSPEFQKQQQTTRDFFVGGRCELYTIEGQG